MHENRYIIFNIHVSVDTEKKYKYNSLIVPTKIQILTGHYCFSARFFASYDCGAKMEKRVIYFVDSGHVKSNRSGILFFSIVYLSN